MDAHTHAVEGDHAEVDADADLHLEGQWIDARHAGGEHFQNPVQRRTDPDAAGAAQIERISARAVEDRSQFVAWLDRRAVLVDIGEPQPDRLVANLDSRLGPDLQQRIVFVRYGHRPGGLDVEEQVRLAAADVPAADRLAAEQDDALDAEPRQQGDRARNGQRGTRYDGVDRSADVPVGSGNQKWPEGEVGTDEIAPDVAVGRTGFAR